MSTTVPVAPNRYREELAGLAAIVTGGSRGIGRAISHALAASGADVVVASRKFESCVEATKAITAATGRRVVPVACHVGRWDDCDRLVDQSLQALGRLDILVNNAGMSPGYDRLETVSESLYDKTLAVNLKGPFRLGTLAAAHMAAHDGGSIINIGSISSLMPGQNELPYACAKAGLNVLTVGLAQAYAPRVRVNAILPGPVRTDLTRAFLREWDASATPLGRAGEPDEIAPLVVHLSGPRSSFTTGAIIRVDGGSTGVI